MEMFLSLLLLLSAWTAQETFCRSLNNSTGNGGISTGPVSEEESEMMHHPGLVKILVFVTRGVHFSTTTKYTCFTTQGVNSFR